MEIGEWEGARDEGRNKQQAAVNFYAAAQSIASVMYRRGTSSVQVFLRRGGGAASSRIHA